MTHNRGVWKALNAAANGAHLTARAYIKAYRRNPKWVFTETTYVSRNSDIEIRKFLWRRRKHTKALEPRKY